jgi:hypothetical protein
MITGTPVLWRWQETLRSFQSMSGCQFRDVGLRPAKLPQNLVVRASFGVAFALDDPVVFIGGKGVKPA